MNLRSIGILCGCFALCASSLHAQPKSDVKPAVIDDSGSQVQRVVIVNGTQTQVRYIGKNLSSSEQSLLRELEQAETELAVSRQAEQDRLETLAREESESREKAAMRMQVMKAAAALPTQTVRSTYKETPQVGNAIANFLTPFTFSTYPSGGVGFNGGINSNGGSTVTSAVPSIAAPINVGAAPVNAGVPTTSGVGAVTIPNGSTPINTGMINNGGFFGGGGGYYGYPPLMNAPPQQPAMTSVTTESHTSTKGLELAAQIALSAPASSAAAPVMAPSSAMVKAEANYQAVLSRLNQSDALRVALNGQKAKATITFAGIPDVELGARVLVTYKAIDNTVKTAEGPLLRDDPMYLVLRTQAGRMSIPRDRLESVVVKE
jgi:hypothetical protein